MAQKDTFNIPPPEAWQVDTLRVTVFLAAIGQIDEPTWWTDLVGEEPEAKTSRQKGAELRQEGPFEPGKLTLNINPLRVDWTLSTTDDQKQKGEIYIGNFPELVDKFSTLMLRWFGLGTCPEVHRLAFGAILLLPVENRSFSYRQLGSYLPSVKLDPEGSSDFNYQINRPRTSTSGIPDLQINRLTRWSSSALYRFSVSLASAKPIPAKEEMVACRLELDISTSHHFTGDIDRGQLPSVFKELVELGKEIAKKGDTP